MYFSGWVELKEDTALKFEMPSFILLNKCSFAMQFHILILSQTLPEKIGSWKINYRHNPVTVVGGLWTRGKSNGTNFYLAVTQSHRKGKKKSHLIPRYSLERESNKMVPSTCQRTAKKVAFALWKELTFWLCLSPLMLNHTQDSIVNLSCFWKYRSTHSAREQRPVSLRNTCYTCEK